MLPLESEDVTGTNWAETKVLLIAYKAWWFPDNTAWRSPQMYILKNRGILSQDVEGEVMV